MYSFLVVLIIGMTPLIDHSLLQTIVTFISKKLHNCHTYPMIMLLCLCGFWAHINIVFCNDSEKIFPGISGKYVIIMRFFEHGKRYTIAYIKTSVIWYADMLRRSSFWIIVFDLMVISFKQEYNGNGVSRFLRCLWFANEVSLVCLHYLRFLFV